MMLLLCMVSLVRSVGAQESQASAEPSVRVIVQMPEPEAKLADRQPPVELLFDDPQEQVDPAQVTMTLDGADVTSFLEITPGRVRYVSPGDLPPGRRTVQITLTNREGQPLEISEWTFVVQWFAGLEDVALPLEFSGTYQYAARQQTATDPRHLFTTNLRLADRVAAGSWATSLEGNLRYTDELRPQENKADVPDYLFTAQWGQAQIQVGDVIVDESQLAAPNLGRRGAKMTLPIAPLRSELHAFVTQTENQAGLRNALRFTDPKNRLYGIGLHVTPFTEPQVLQMRGLYLGGKSPGTPGLNIGNAEGQQQGQSWTWGLASTLFRERLQIEFENSWTSFDSFLGDFVGPDRDTAWRGQMRWNDELFSLADTPMQFFVLSGYERVGTHYRTVANPAIVADREGVNAMLGVTWRALTLNLGGAAFRDNLGLVDTLPRTTEISSTATLAVIVPDWPTFGLTYMRTAQRSSHQPPEFGVRRVDNTLDRLSLTVGYSREFWSANLDLGFTTLHNKTEAAPTQIPDSQTWDITLSGLWTPDPAFSLSSSLSLAQRIDKNRQVLSSEDTLETRRITTDTVLLTLTTAWVLWPEYLTLDLQGSSGYNRASDGSTESTNVDGSLQLSWNVEHYTWKSLKQVLSVRSTLSWQRDIPSQFAQLEWGVFVGLNVFFPVHVESFLDRPPGRSARLGSDRPARYRMASYNTPPD